MKQETEIVFSCIRGSCVSKAESSRFKKLLGRFTIALPDVVIPTVASCTSRPNIFGGMDCK